MHRILFQFQFFSGGNPRTLATEGSAPDPRGGEGSEGKGHGEGEGRGGEGKGKDGEGRGTEFASLPLGG